MSERVSLPDPNARPLLHPVDVAEARRLFVRAWVMSLLSAPEMLVLVAALAWFLSGSWLAPTLAVLSLGIIAELARRHLTGEAWARVPRRRRDLALATPASYTLADAVVRPAALTAGVALALAGLAEHDAGTRSWAVGSAVGIGLALVGVPLVRCLRTGAASAALEAGGGLACVVTGSTVVLWAGWAPVHLDVSTALLGAGVLVGVHALWLSARAGRVDGR